MSILTNGLPSVIKPLVCDPLKILPPHPLPEVKSIFGAVIPPLLLSFFLDKYTPKTKLCPTKDVYDYIVVGAGSAGSVVASRLSEERCVSVLVLEAGPTPCILTDIPGISRIFMGTEVDYNYQTVEQKHTAKALIGRKVQLPLGRAVGGSSVINAMFFVRGHRQIFDDWERLGATGWNYTSLLPYFKRVEHYIEGIDPAYHGYKGYVTAEHPQYFPPQKRGILKAARQLGYRIGDVNGPIAKDYFNIASSYRNGTRCSSAKAYLVPAEDRENLDIVANAKVTKLIIGKRCKKSRKRRVIGVEVDIYGLKMTIKARREVIVSAGAIHSPQLLMLSGIGPKEHLEELGIEVLEDLPVGENLHDHPGVFVPYTLTDKEPTYLEKVLNPLNVMSYLTQRKGPLVSNMAISATAFLSNDPNASRCDLPDHQLYFVENVPFIVRSQLNLKPEEYQRMFGPYDTRTSMICISEILNPISRGSVTLRSTDPYDMPNIDPNYFADEQDVIDVLEGLKNCDKIFEHKAMAHLKPEPFMTSFKNCEGIDRYNKEEYFRCYIDSFAVTIAHSVGTARMGNPRDRTTVVDPKLRVLGFCNLRVIDASVFPKVPAGNTNIPTMAIAEKAAEIIKKLIKCKAEEE